MELYSWAYQVFIEEIGRLEPNFEYVLEAASYLIELGVERNSWKISVLGKNLLASVLSFSEEITEIENAITLFEEIKFNMQKSMPDLYASKYHTKAVEKKMEYNKGKKNEN